MANPLPSAVRIFISYGDLFNPHPGTGIMSFIIGGLNTIGNIVGSAVLWAIYSLGKAVQGAIYTFLGFDAFTSNSGASLPGGQPLFVFINDAFKNLYLAMFALGTAGMVGFCMYFAFQKFRGKQLDTKSIFYNITLSIFLFFSVGMIFKVSTQTGYYLYNVISNNQVQTDKNGNATFKPSKGNELSSPLDTALLDNTYDLGSLIYSSNSNGTLGDYNSKDILEKTFPTYYQAPSDGAAHPGWTAFDTSGNSKEIDLNLTHQIEKGNAGAKLEASYLKSNIFGAAQADLGWSTPSGADKDPSNKDIDQQLGYLLTRGGLSTGSDNNYNMISPSKVDPTVLPSKDWKDDQGYSQSTSSQTPMNTPTSNIGISWMDKVSGIQASVFSNPSQTNYHRLHINYIAAIVRMIVFILLLLVIAYKIFRAMYEFAATLLVGGVGMWITAESGAYNKALLKNSVGVGLTAMISGITIALYNIFSAAIPLAIPATDIATTLLQVALYVILAAISMDGASVFIDVFGMDGGLNFKSILGGSMLMGMAGKALSSVRGAGNKLKRSPEQKEKAKEQRQAAAASNIEKNRERKELKGTTPDTRSRIQKFSDVVSTGYNTARNPSMYLAPKTSQAGQRRELAKEAGSLNAKANQGTLTKDEQVRKDALDMARSTTPITGFAGRQLNRIGNVNLGDKFAKNSGVDMAGRATGAINPAMLPQTKMKSEKMHDKKAEAAMKKQERDNKIQQQAQDAQAKQAEEKRTAPLRAQQEQIQRFESGQKMAKMRAQAPTVHRANPTKPLQYNAQNAKLNGAGGKASTSRKSAPKFELPPQTSKGLQPNRGIKPQVGTNKPQRGGGNDTPHTIVRNHKM